MVVKEKYGLFKGKNERFRTYVQSFLHNDRSFNCE